VSFQKSRPSYIIWNFVDSDQYWNVTDHLKWTNEYITPRIGINISVMLVFQSMCIVM
jgi:hypothetical protein